MAQAPEQLTPFDESLFLPYLLDLSRTAGPRGFTFAGRAAKPGESLERIMSRMPIGELESGGQAAMAPQSLAGAIGLGKGLAAGFKALPAAIAGIPKLTKAVAERIRGSVLQKPVFHGTPQVFGEFDIGKAQPGLYGKGIYFTENPAITEGYAGKSVARWHPDFQRTLDNLRADAKRLGDAMPAGNRQLLNDLEASAAPVAPNVRPVFLNVKKPFDVEAAIEPAQLKKIAAVLDDLIPGTKLAKEFSSITDYVSGSRLYDILREKFQPDMVTAILKKAGYDSITHIGGKVSGGKPHRVWIVFDPKQAISAFEKGEVKQSLPPILLPSMPGRPINPRTSIIEGSTSQELMDRLLKVFQGLK